MKQAGATWQARPFLLSPCRPPRFGLLLSGLKTVDRYILREWLKIFGLSIAVTMGLLVLNDMYSNFGDLMDYEAELEQIVRYYLMALPGFIPVVLPIALLLSLLFCLGNLHRNNELIALRAGGLGIGRITVTIWIGGLILSGVLLLLNARVVPWSVEQSRKLLERIEFSHLAEEVGGQEAATVHLLTFDNRPENRMWFMNRFNPITYRGFGVQVHKLDENRREVLRIMARETHYDDYAGEWVFTDGRKLTFDRTTGGIVESLPFDQLVDDALDETPEIMLLFHKRPKDLSLNELRTALGVMDEENPLVNTFQVRYHMLLAGSFSCLIIVGLAIPFSTTGVRVNPMVGISKSLGLFLLYYLLENVARIIGERDLVTPMLAAWLPGLVMAILAAWFFRRAI